MSSVIATVKADLISRITTALGEGVIVGNFAGEAKAMEKERPAVLVQWTGAITGESVEFGMAPPGAYEYDPTFMLWICTEDGATDGDVQAAEHMEAIRGALQGEKIADLGYACPYRDSMLSGRTEAVYAVESGIYLYVQAWKIEQLID